MDKLVSLILLAFIILSCSTQENASDAQSTALDSTKEINIDKQIKDAVIYEVNIRQFTPEGDFNSFREHIPRIADLGVDILWLMPIHPIGELNRKGGMGSYYSVQDYKAINPDYGNMTDLHALVEEAHEHDMLVILDWVANHTSWDNVWMQYHPEWFTLDSSGQMVPPVADWSDVVDLNYEQVPMQDAMIDALQYWVKEFDIDGYRCDVAGMVPLEFWNRMRDSLDVIRPVFMLAEAEDHKLLDKAFNMDYAWELHHIMNEIAKGNMQAKDLEEYYNRTNTDYDMDDIRMSFTSNHDENSWNGNAFKRMKEAYPLMIHFSFITPSMPLIYGGQEAGLDHDLAFFEKDTIVWREHEMNDVFQSLIDLKSQNPALWNGDQGGSMEIRENSDPDVLHLVRKMEGNEIHGIFNMSGSAVTIPLELEKFSSPLGHKIFDSILNLEPWAYRIYKIEN